jgi:tetratricopeptide (TPR) repeat protein
MAIAQRSQVSKKAQDLYTKAVDAASKRNYGYTVELCLSALDIEPRFAEARKLLRETEILRDDEKKVPLFLRRLFHAIFHIPAHIIIFFEKSFGKWESVLNRYERLLKNNSKCVYLLKMHARAAEQLGMAETAVISMETAKRYRPNDMKIISEIGYMYKDNGNVEEAKACFEQVMRDKPDDKDVRKALHDLAAMGTIIKGSWDDTDSFRSSIKNKDFATEEEIKLRAIRTDDEINRIIKDYESRIAQNPDDIDSHKALANYYIEAKRFDDAVEIFQKAIDKNPSDVDLPQMQLRVIEMKYEYMIEQDEKKLEQDTQNSALKNEVERLRNEKQEYILKELTARVKKYPSNLPLRYELGNAYMNKGMLDEAIKEFQIAKASARYHTQSLNALGTCFRLKKYYDLAADQFEAALKDLYVMDSFKKEVMYNLGCTYQEVGKKKEALDIFKIIYSEDIGFMDVSERYNALHADLRKSG